MAHTRLVGQEKTRVLLIDDDEDSLIIIRHALDESEHSAYDVEWTSEPGVAVEMLSDNQFDVCLLDYYFAEGDGLDFLKEIRESGIQVPVIMYTGQKDANVELEAARVGADDYLDKDDLSPALLKRMIYYALERRQVQAELVRMAKSDALTGAANRIGLYEFIDQAQMRGRRHQREIAILLLDLDRFKQLNDKFGHALGDAVLIHVVNTLKRYVRDSDLVARIGGDEFVVILDDVAGVAGSEAATNKIQELLCAGFEIDGRELEIRASIGLAVWPLHGDTLDELLAVADQAMYVAKNAGIKAAAQG